MSPAKPPARLKKLGYAALIGVVLGLVCQSLPPDYRTLCTAVARIVSTACGLP